MPMKVSEIGPRYHVSKTLSLKPTNTVFIPLIKPIPDEIPDENEVAAVFSRPGAGQASCHNSSYRPDTKEANFKKRNTATGLTP